MATEEGHLIGDPITDAQVERFREALADATEGAAERARRAWELSDYAGAIMRRPGGGGKASTRTARPTLRAIQGGAAAPKAS
jgi:hypothetical protein